MSKNIDNKVVSMEFDNSKFERNVKTSMSTLDKLKHALNFDSASKGFEKIESESNKVNFSGLNGATETVKARFSALEVVAVTALANITNSAVNAGKRLVASLSIDQIAAGWNKYEQKTGAVQTIINATGKSIDEVNKYLDKLMWFSDETSYSFTDMTQSLGQLTSAGADIDKVIPMIEGIANATAYAGKGTAEFSRAIYNLNQSYSAGNLQYMDWKSLELAGVASKELKQTFIDTAIALGKLDKNGKLANGELVTIANFGPTLKEKWADTEVMEVAFGKFSELTTAAYEAVRAGEFDTASDAIKALSKDYSELSVKAFRSAQEAKSFTEAIEATKDAVSSGWLNTFEIIFGNYEEAKKLWTNLANTLWDMFASGSEARNELLSDALSSKWPTFIDKINEAGVATEDFEKAVIEAGKEHGLTIDKMIEEEGSLQEVVNKGLIPKKVLTQTLKSLAKIGKGHTDLSKKLEEFQKITQRVWNGEFGNGEKRIKALTEAGYDYNEVQALVNKTQNGRILTLEDLNEQELKSIGYTKEEISAIQKLADEAEKTGTPIRNLIDAMEKPTGRELLIESFNNGLQTIISTLDIVKTAWGDTFDAITAEDIYGTLEKVSNFSVKTLKYVGDNSEKFEDILRGVFAVIDIITSFAGNVVVTTIKKVLKVLGYANSDILTIGQSLGLLMVKIRDWIKEHKVITNLYGIFTDYLVDIIKNIYDFIKAFVKLPVVEKNLKRIETVLSDLSFAGVKSFFDGGIDIIKGFIGEIGQINDLNFDKFMNKVKDLFKRLWGYFTNLSNLSPEIKNTVDLVTADALSGFGTFEVKFKSFKEAIKSVVDWFKNVLPKDLKISVGNILAVGIGAALIKMMNGLTKAFGRIDSIINVFANVAGAVSNIANGIAGIINGIKNAIVDLSKAQSKKIKSEAWLNIAKSILILASAIAILALLPTDKMLYAAGALAGLVLVMALLSKVVGKMNGTVDFAKIGAGFLAMAGAVFVLGMALKKIDSLDNPIQSAIVVIGLLVALVGVGKVAAEFSGSMQKSIGYLIPMAAAVLVLAIAMKKLSSLSASEILSGLLGLASCVGALALIMLACKALKVDNVRSGVVAAAALILMVLAFKMVAKLDPEDIIVGLVKITAMLALLIPIFLTTRIAGKEASKSAGAILAISASLILISIAMKMIATIDPNEIGRATLAIMGIIGMFAVVIAALSLLKTISGQKSNAAQAALTIAAIGVAIVAIAGAMLLLSLLKEDAMKRSLAAVATIMGMFALLIAASGLSKDCYKTIAGIAVVVGVLAIALGALSMISPEGLDSATKALTAVMAMLAIVVASTGLAKKSMSTIIVLGAIAALLMVLIGHLESVDMAPSIETAEALGILIGSLAASMAILSLAKSVSWKTVGQVAVLGVLVAALAGIIGYFESMDLTVSLENAKALSLLILSLSGAAVLLGVAGLAGFQAGLTGLGVLGLLITEIGLILAALGGLNRLTDGEAGKVLEEGIPMLVSIGEGLGRFVGSIVGGVISGLVGAGEGLTTFMNSIKGFIDGCSAITPEVGEGMKSLATGLLAITGAQLIDGLSKLFGSRVSLDELGQDLSSFGIHMKDFADSMKGVNKEDLETGCNAFKMISEASSSLGRHGGLWQKLVGDNKISDFVAMLADCFGGTKGGESPFDRFVSGINTYSGQWKDIESNAKSFVGILGTISEFADTLSTHGGFIKSKITGDNKINDFVKMLADCFSVGGFYKFAISLLSLNGSWEAISDGTKSFISILTDISDFSNSLSKHGGFASILKGDNKINDFIKDFSDAISGPFKEFVGEISSMGEDLENTKYNVHHLDVIFTELGKVSKSIPDNYSEVFTGKPLTKISKDLAGAAPYISSFNSNMSGVSGERLTGLGTGLANLINAVSTATDVNASKLGEFSKNLSDLGKKVVNFFKDAITSKIIEVRQSGAKIVEAYINGINSNKSKAVKTGKALFEGFKSGLVNTSNYSSAKSAGVYFAQGFIDGINGKIPSVRTAAWNMGKAANTALRNSLAEHSPSKISYGFGGYYGLGFINGIKDKINDVAKTSEDLGQTSINSLRDAISRASDTVLNDVDTQPTIRPVLDLSNVRDGANKLNGMFGNMQPVGVLSTSMPYALATSAGSVSTSQPVGVNMNFTIYGAEGQDVNELADIVSRKISTSLNRRSNTWR